MSNTLLLSKKWTSMRATCTEFALGTPMIEVEAACSVSADGFGKGEGVRCRIVDHSRTDGVIGTSRSLRRTPLLRRPRWRKERSRHRQRLTLALLTCLRARAREALCDDGLSLRGQWRALPVLGAGVGLSGVGAIVPRLEGGEAEGDAAVI